MNFKFSTLILSFYVRKKLNMWIKLKFTVDGVVDKISAMHIYEIYDNLAFS